MTEYISKVDIDNLVLKDTSPNDALDTLKKQKKKFDDSRQRIELLNNYQDTLQQNSTVVKEIEMFDKKWNNRNKLWENVNSFNSDYAHWMGANFKEQVDANDVEKKVKTYLVVCNDVKINFGKNAKDEVLDMLSVKVREVNSMLDLVLALGNKALMPKHWKMIFELVDKDDNPQGNYTLKDFKDWGM